MRNLKCKKQSVLILLVMFIIVAVSRVAAFKDLSTEANEAADKFSSEGMLGSFIYQFGQDMFRPDGNVTRENLLLVLGEYHILTKKLLSENRQIRNRLNKLSKLKSQQPQQSQQSQDLSEENMELILREFQKTLEPMLRNSKTIMQLKQQVGGGAGTAAAPDFQNKFENVDKKDILILEADIKKIKNKITALNKTIHAQRRYVNETTGEKTTSKEIFRSSDDNMIPFWVKISMGFTTIALFFMAR